ncbi:unnamed protein product [Lepidochelys olivacea]
MARSASALHRLSSSLRVQNASWYVTLWKLDWVRRGRPSPGLGLHRALCGERTKGLHLHAAQAGTHRLFVLVPTEESELGVRRREWLLSPACSGWGSSPDTQVSFYESVRFRFLGRKLQRKVRALV